MLKNKYLAKEISNCSFYKIREQIIMKSKEFLIPVHLVSRFFASSKTCSSCGHVKKDLKLSEREYNCLVCGNKMNRDYNASINIRDTKEYVLI